MSNQNTQQFLQAIQLLYHPSGSSPAQISSANAFLTNLQNSPDAWNVCRDILSTKGLGLAEAYWFCATTFHRKVEKNLSEVPKEQLLLLRNDLFNILNWLCSDTSAHIPEEMRIKVRMQICRTLGTLVVQILDLWGSALTDLISRTQNMDLTNTIALVDIIGAVAESFVSNNTALSDENYDFVTVKMDQSASPVFALMEQLIRQSQSDALTISAVRCVADWMRFFGSKNLFKILPQLSFILEFCVKFVQTPSIFEYCLDILVHLLRALSYDLNASMQSAQKLLDCVFDLHTKFGALLVDETFDQKVAYGLCRLFNQLGECFASFIASTFASGTSNADSRLCERIVRIVLDCTNHSDPEIAFVSLNFWFILAKEITILRPEQRQVCKTALSPAFMQMIRIMERILRFPDDLEEMDDSVELKKEYRTEALDVLYDATSVVSSDMVLSYVINRLNQLLNTPSAWQDIEAVLFVFYSFADTIPRDESKYVSIILGNLDKFPNHPMIRHTVILSIGKCSEWLNFHPQFIPTALQHIVSGLLQSSTKLIKSGSAVALRYLCISCTEFLRDVSTVQSLLQVYKALVVESDPALGEDDYFDIIEAVATVSSALPLEQFKNALDVIFHPLFIKVYEQLTSSIGSAEDINLYFRKISTAFKYLHVHQFGQNSQTSPLIPIALDLWKITPSLLSQYNSHTLIMENFCRSWKYIFKECGKQLSIEELLLPLLKGFADFYLKSRKSAFLYIISVCVDVYGDDRRLQDVFLQLYNIITTSTLDLFAKNRFDQFPGVTDDFFGLSRRYLEKLPMIPYSNPDLLSTVFECAVMALSVHHRDAHENVCLFLSTFFTQTPIHLDQSVAVLQLRNNAITFTNAIVQSISGHVTKSKLNEIVAVAHLAVQHQSEFWKSCFVQSFASQPEALCQERDLFLHALFTEKRNGDARRAAMEFYRKSVALR